MSLQTCGIELTPVDYLKLGGQHQLRHRLMSLNDYLFHQAAGVLGIECVAIYLTDHGNVSNLRVFRFGNPFSLTLAVP